ncbi:MAG: glycoside hydrolase family 92 protein, partial [Propionibacteriaceae bacterium]|nr:glycoside hydrolase family 92 protein [Propionibacteriaceae bacterium]
MSPAGPARTGAGPADLVDTRRGSHAGPEFSRGNTIPALGVPHGFTLVTPATDASDRRWPYRPYVHDDPAGRRLEAVQICHHASPWIGDFGVLQFMPFSGAPTSARSKRRRHIRPGTELARPYGYAAELLGPGSRAASHGAETGDHAVSTIGLSVTATSHTAAFRVAGDGSVGFIIDQVDDRGDLRFDQDTTGRVEFCGWVEQRADQAWGKAPRTYFVGQTGGPAQWGRLNDDGRGHVAGHVTQRQCPGSSMTEESKMGRLPARGSAGDSPNRNEIADPSWEAASSDADDHTGVFEVRVATSFISIDQARRSLELEADWSMSFEAIQARARADWNAVCSTISVAIDKDEHRALADRDLRATVAADLYRLHLYPNDMSENAGSEEAPSWRHLDVFGATTRSGQPTPATPPPATPPPATPTPATPTPDHTSLPVIPGHAVVTNGYWDTYRTVWPLLCLLDPSLTGALLDGQLAQVRCGGWMARWSAPGYVDSMVGTSSDQ